MASAAWERRNTAAKDRGFENYYDYRMHAYGTRPERVSGDEAEALRGHRGRGSLEQVLRTPGRIALITELPYAVGGVWTHMQYTVLFTDTNIRKYRVRMPDNLSLEAWRDAIRERDIEFIEYASRHGRGVQAAA